MRSRSRFALAFVLLSSTAGCSGGGAGSSAAPPATATPSATPSAASHALDSATATIVIPPKTAAASLARRRRAWISPSTQSIAITATNTDGFVENTTQALTSTTEGCSATPNGGTSCVIPFEAPATTGTQTDEFDVTLFDYGTNIGSILGYGVSKGNVLVAGTTNAFTLTVGGVLCSIAFAPGNYDPFVRTPEDIQIPVTFADADGNAIGGAFDAPATVTLSGPAAGSFTITQPAGSGASATIPDPTQLVPANTITLHYDGTGTYQETATLTVTSNSQETLDDIGVQATASLTITISEPT